jgi:predicted phage terminase large subunit-like protein
MSWKEKAEREGIRKSENAFKKEYRRLQNETEPIGSLNAGEKRIANITPEELSQALPTPWKYLPHTFAMHLSEGRWRPFRYLIVLSHILTNLVARGGARILVSIPPRHGKALHVDTPIAVPSGWKRIVDLRIGDIVFDAYGKQTRVTNITQVWKNRNVFSVKTDTGGEIIADEKHEWDVRLERKRPGVTTIWETGKLAARTSPRNPLIYKHHGLDLPNIKLPIDPYTLGVWLGDGRNADGDISGSPDDLRKIRERIERAYEITPKSNDLRVGIKGLRVKLRNNDLLHKKRIPIKYLRSSKEQRLALLQGLIDTDGYVANDGQVEFCSILEGLAEDVKELVNSLGYKASIIIGNATLNGRFISKKYRVMFYMPNAANLQRKKEKCIEPKRTPNHYITVTPAGKSDTVCIETEAHTFLAGKEMIPTRNSEFISKWFPAWYLSNWPEDKVILTTYEAEFAASWGRQVRDIIAANSGLLGVGISASSKASYSWETTYGGGMRTAGAGGPITGKGGHLLICDDPHKNWAEAMSLSIRENIHKWYDSTFYTRADEERTSIIILHCMTGDTPVMMADGTDKYLKNIRPGDVVATYKDGCLSTSKVIDWVSNGLDKVFEIKTTSGIVVKANERHPFLINDKGVRKWIRVKDLHPDHEIYRVNGGSGREKFVKQADAISQLSAEVTVHTITTQNDGQMVSGLHLPLQTPNHVLQQSSNIGTGSHWKRITKFLKSKMAVVRSANTHQKKPIAQNTGTGCCALTIATILARFVDSCAMTATCFLSESIRSKFSKRPSGISDFILERIESIIPAGIEEVFDVQIADTENFIANQLVSHNTRWHEDDMIGRLIAKQQGYIYIRFPALAEEEDDILGRRQGEALCPERFSEKMLLGIKENVGNQIWAGLYQQRPAAEEGNIFKRKDINYYKVTPIITSIMQSWDTGYKDTKGSAYSVCQTWGTGPLGYILLDQFRGMLEWPELLRKAKQLYNDWHPTGVLIEDKASGQSLIQDLRRNTAIPVIPITPELNKVLRAREISPVFEGGRVWVPDSSIAPWIDALIDAWATFPNTKYLDETDTMSQMMKYWFYRSSLGAIVSAGRRVTNSVLDGFQIIPNVRNIWHQR